MGMIERSIRRPVTVLVAVILVLIFGMIGFFRVPVQLTPNVDQPVISVTTNWFGASPQEIEREIVQEQEEILKTVSGLREMNSRSTEGQGVVELKFRVGVNKEAALNEVRDKLRQVPSYPQDVDEPVAESVDSNTDNFIAWLVLRPIDGDPANLRPTTDTSAPGVHFTGDVRLLENWAEDEVKPILERVEGIAEINVLGGREREMQVRVDLDRLAARGLGIAEFNEALRRENVNVTAGAVAEGKRETSVRAVGQYEHPDEILRTVIAFDEGGSPVYVGDVAEAGIGYKRQIGFVRSKGADVLAINAKRETGTNVLQVMDGLKAAVERANTEIIAPRGWGIELHQVYDETVYVRQSVRAVTSDLLTGAVLATFVLFITLRSLGATLVVAISIPISIVGTFLGMALTGRNLNVISMAGLSFAIGMGVDNTIVVLENIFRHREMGKDRIAAAIDGTREVWGAIVAATLANMAVFLPVVFIQEEAGQLFRDISIAISISLFLYMVVSPTVIPMLATLLLRHVPVAFSHGHEAGGEKTMLGTITGPLARAGTAMSETFYKLVHWLTRGVFRRLALVSAFVLASVAGAWLLAPPRTYLPSGNQNFVFSLMFTPPGYSLGEFQAIGKHVESQLRPWWEAGQGSPEHLALQDGWKQAMAQGVVPGLTQTVQGMQAQLDELKAAPITPAEGQTLEQATEARALAIAGIEQQQNLMNRQMWLAANTVPPAIDEFFFVGYGGQLFMGAASADLMNVEPLARLMESTIQGIPGTMGFASQVPIFRLGEGTGSSIDLTVSGDDYDKVRGAAAAVQGVMMAEFQTFAQANPPNFNLGRSETRITPDRLRAAAAGVYTSEIREMARVAVDGQIIGDYRDAGDVIDLTVIARVPEDRTTDQLKAIPMATASGRSVPLSSVADFQDAAAAQQINRLERVPSISLGVQLPTGMTVEEARTIVESRVVTPLKEAGVLNGLQTKFTGSADKLSEFQSAFIGGFILAAVITYLLLAALFESFVHPLVIMMSVPLALVGGFAGLWVLNKTSGNQLDVLTMLGFVILIGTIVNNPILIVHQALNYIREGMDRNQAIALSTQTRVRPIFMSVVVSVAGMLPLVIGSGQGSELYRGLGAVVVGGLLVSTLFTLLLTPTLMSLAMDIQDWFVSLFRGKGKSAGTTRIPPVQTEAVTSAT